jgi:putative transcriptional regulator
MSHPERKSAMKTVRMKIDIQQVKKKAIGRINVRRVDATSESDIAKHKDADDNASMMDAANFARRVRRRLGFSQAKFAERIGVSLDTIGNWEQVKRCPMGAAKALLKVLDKAPEAALAALH